MRIPYDVGSDTRVITRLAAKYSVRSCKTLPGSFIANNRPLSILLNIVPRTGPVLNGREILLGSSPPFILLLLLLRCAFSDHPCISLDFSVSPPVSDCSGQNTRV